jgi:hypothetical protein
VDAGKLLVDEPHSAAEVEMMSMKSALPQSDQMVVNQLFVDQDSFRKNVEQPVHSDSVAVDANLAFEAVAGEIQESIRLADVESTIVPLASGRHSDNASVDLANLFGHDDNVVAESVEPHQMRSAPAEEVVAPHSAPSVDIDLTETDESNPAEVERNCHDDDVNHASEVQSGSNTDLAVVDRAAEHATEAKLVDVNPNPPTQPAAQTSDAVDSVASAPVRSKRPKVVDLRKAPPSDH